MDKGYTRLKVKAAFFCADNGMVASTDPGWLQTAFSMLARLFGRVGMNKNVIKTVGMSCHTFRASGVRAEKTYTHGMLVEGRSYKERQRERFN